MVKKERRSFTLAETMVVLVIVATMAGTTVVAVNSLRSLILDAETRKAVSDISWARQRTVATNAGHAVVFTNAVPSKYSVYKSPTGTSADLTAENLLKDVMMKVSLQLARVNLWIYSPRGNIYAENGSGGAVSSFSLENQGKTKNITVYYDTGYTKIE
ncbi:MAG: hypothetical protein AABZ65_02340 [Candidatus Omnitrophota bacterium]